MPEVCGETLRAWRRSRGWDVPEMARRLRNAAGNDTMPVHDALVRMIYRWERLSLRTERYELLYRAALGHPPEEDEDQAPATATATAGNRAGSSRHDFLALPANASSLLDMLGTQGGAAQPYRARIDSEAAEGLTHVVLGYRQVYRSAGAASLLGPVCGTLNLLSELAPPAGAYNDVVVSLIGQAGSLAGVILMLDQRDFSASRPYLAIAARAARQSGADELMAITLACRAFYSAYGGDPPDGLAFAREALALAGRAAIHPQTHGWVAAVASEMHATLGDEAACMRALEISSDQLSRPMPPGPWKGIGAFSEAKLTAYRGADLLRLGRYREARAELRDALAHLDPALAKHRCTAHIDLADAYAQDGEPAEAARHAISALDIIAFTRHVDNLRRVVALHETLRPSGTALARELGSRLLEVRAAS